MRTFLYNIFQIVNKFQAKYLNCTNRYEFLLCDFRPFSFSFALKCIAVFVVALSIFFSVHFKLARSRAIWRLTSLKNRPQTEPECEFKAKTIFLHFPCNLSHSFIFLLLFCLIVSSSINSSTSRVCLHVLFCFAFSQVLSDGLSQF